MSVSSASTEPDKRAKGKKPDGESIAEPPDATTQNGISKPSLTTWETDEFNLANMSNRELRAFKHDLQDTLSKRRKAEKAAERLIREETEKKEAETARKERAKVLLPELTNYK